jgi:hypothetical protein
VIELEQKKRPEVSGSEKVEKVKLEMFGKKAKRSGRVIASEEFG